MTAPGNRLVTLVFSHYNEKARWALEYCGIDFRESGYLPGFSQLAVLSATRGRGGKADAVSSAFSTPVLITSYGEAICDSTAIAQWASTLAAPGGPGPLFPEPGVLEIVEELGRALGPYTRLAAYYFALQDPAMMRHMAEKNVGRAQTLAFRAFAPLASAMIKRSLGVDEPRFRRAVVRVREQAAAIERRLEGRSYLFGDSFTAADLTFAALMVPVLLVSREEGYGASLPALEAMVPEARALVEEMRATRAGAFALEMYRRHRKDRWSATPRR